MRGRPKIFSFFAGSGFLDLGYEIYRRTSLSRFFCWWKTYKARRISVAEALALQSMPQNFILPFDMSLTNMFKTIGNGVPFLAAKALAKTIFEFLKTTNFHYKNSEKQLEIPLIFR